MGKEHQGRGCCTLEKKGRMGMDEINRGKKEGRKKKERYMKNSWK